MNDDFNERDMDNYLSGKKLYGDDFSTDQIKNWHQEESEGYANLGNNSIDSYAYEYHRMNIIHGYSKLKGAFFDDVLGIGSAWGDEFKPVISKIKRLTIVEPSDNMMSGEIGHLKPGYIKPNVDGRLKFDDNSFDLITSFGALHHTPNVTFVLNEMLRVLKPNGYLLLREPIVSMGDWRKQRSGLTKNERGIPVAVFDSIFSDNSMQIISKEYCFMMTYAIENTIGRFLKEPIYSYKSYVVIDKLVSRVLKRNVHYHATKKIHKIAPSSIFYVLQKPSLQ